ncbi:MAG: FAD-dependent oxidoreductase [bacterium]|nr:FAD-dependent oxidoreductase [bacterium]
MKLFTPMKIGPVELRNRVVSTAHGAFLDFYRPGVAPDQYIAYQERRAAGGCGFIIQQAMQVHPSSQPDGHFMWERDDILPKFAAMAAALHAHGTRTVVQLAHFGGQFRSEGNEDLAALWGFSPILSPSGWEAVHEMTAAQIESVIDGYVATAEVVVEGGLDGVELHATHGYLLQQSFSPWANQRDDEWGKQFRFLDEVMARVRAAIGSDKIMGLRISAEDWIRPERGGLGFTGLAEVAEHACATGQLDYLNHSEGARSAHYAKAIGDFYATRGEFLPLTAGLRRVAGGVPVIAVGKIMDAGQAEQALEDESCDLVAMTRAQIADPDLVIKTQRGESDRVRPCVGANSGCVDRMERALPITCFHNPDVGREWRLEPLEIVPAPRKVLVVGAGPAGLKAAEIAARRGHRVTVAEVRHVPGGALRAVESLGPPCELMGAVTWIVGELEILGVDIRYSTEVDRTLLEELQPDVLVLATGADGADSVTTPLVETVDTAEAMGLQVAGRRIVLVDHVGYQEQAFCAEHLASEGATVAIVTPFPSIGPNIGFTHIRGHMERLHSLNVAMHTSSVVTGYAEGTVIGRHVYSREALEIPADLVVMGGQKLPRLDLMRVAEELGVEVHLAGDAVAGRTALHAFREGDNVGRAV